MDELPEIAGYTFSSPVSALEDSFRVSYKALRYHVSARPFAGARGARTRLPLPSAPVSTAADVPPFHVAVVRNRSGRRDRFSVAMQRARHPAFLSMDELYARSFMYELFDYSSQVAQLPLGQSYLHASCIERDGEGVAIMAWGGVGKTSALFKLVSEHGFRFLSDDIGLVDDSGTLWRTPKLIQLHAFNLEGEERLRTMLFGGRSALDRMTWTLRRWRHGPRGARRRVSAEQLFGAGAVAHSAPLHRVYCLERADATDFEARQISTAELCRRAARVVMDVMEPFTFLSQALHSGHHAPILPNHVQVVEEAIKVFARAFHAVPVFNIRVPLRARPGELSDYLVRLMDESPRSRRESRYSR